LVPTLGGTDKETEAQVEEVNCTASYGHLHPESHSLIQVPIFPRVSWCGSLSEDMPQFLEMKKERDSSLSILCKGQDQHEQWGKPPKQMLAKSPC
jgi:hypothetical protein